MLLAPVNFKNLKEPPKIVFLLVPGILGLKPAPNDGTPGSLLHLLDPTAVDVAVPESKSDGNPMRNDICRYPKSLVDCTQCICPWCQVSEMLVYFLKLERNEFQ